MASNTNQRSGGRELTAVEQRKQEIQQRTKQFGNMIELLKPNLTEVLPAGGDVDKLKRIAITAVQKDPSLLNCSRESWITALQLCAQDGLMPDGREAAFVRFKEAVQYMPMVYGLRKKILQSGEIRDIFTAVVYEAEFDQGLFEVTLGSDPKIVHSPLLGKGDRGEIIAAYSVATFKDGTRSFEVMTRAEIETIRMVSQTGKKNEGPWRDWYGEMARKTVLRRHSKSLPMSSDLRDVEVETMFDPAEFARRIGPKPEDTGIAGGPARSSQIMRSETSNALDAIEEKAFGADVKVEPTGGKVEEGEIVDQETGEVTHTGNADDFDWNGWLTSFRDDLERCEDSDEVNDFYEAKVGDLSKAPDATRHAARGLRDARIEALKSETQAEVGEQAEEDAGDDDRDDATRLADNIIARFVSAELLPDLRRYKTDAQAEIDGLDEENAGRVNRAFKAHEDKLKKGRSA